MWFQPYITFFILWHKDLQCRFQMHCNASQHDQGVSETSKPGMFVCLRHHFITKHKHKLDLAVGNILNVYLFMHTDFIRLEYNRTNHMDKKLSDYENF